MSTDARARVDVPAVRSRGWRSVRGPGEGDAVGRFAERFARFMGTARFLAYMTVFVAAWLLWNAFAPLSLRFDDYPFIFLTLMLSLQASYAAPLILLAQNRQTDRDRVTLDQDRSRDERNLAETEFLTREVAALRITLRDVPSRDFVRSELRALLDELDERTTAAAPSAADPQEPPGPPA